MGFAKRLRFYRKRAGLNQKELAAKMNMTRQNYSRYESSSINAEPPLKVLLKLAAVLGTDVNTLLGYEKPEKKITATDYKELIQAITQAREKVLEGTEPDTQQEAVELLESGLNIAKDIYAAYLEKENKDLSDSLAGV